MFWFWKRHIKGKKHIAELDFAEYLGVSEKGKLIIPDLYEMDFM